MLIKSCIRDVFGNISILCHLISDLFILENFKEEQEKVSRVKIIAQQLRI